MNNVLLFDKVTAEVNQYINKVDDLKLIDIANKVFDLNWEFLKYRNLVRMDGMDVGRHRAVNNFYKIYSKASPLDICGIYNYIHNTNYEVDLKCNILKEKIEEPQPANSLDNVEITV